MEYTFQVLKSGWGISVLVKVHELKNIKIESSDFHVADKIYLRITEGHTIKSEISAYWFARAIKKYYPLIIRERGDGYENICLVVESIDFNHTDFQEEGLFFAMQGWICLYYGFPLPNINIEFDKGSNKYIFENL